MSNSFYIHSIPLILKMSIVFYILYFVTLERHSRMSENYLSLISEFYVIPSFNSSQKNKNAKKIFGVSSEKTQPDGQLSLFDSVQELAQELFKEQKKITVKSHENLVSGKKCLLDYLKILKNISSIRRIIVQSVEVG